MSQGHGADRARLGNAAQLIALAVSVGMMIVVMLYVFGFIGPGRAIPDGDHAFTRAEFITIMLMAVTIVLAALTLIVAIAAIWGYYQIQEAATKAATEMADKVAKEVAEAVAARTINESLQMRQETSVSGEEMAQAQEGFS
ncbi:MAG: hypothetical protein HQL39_11815 [Alphaproteobacteria bacterium]|nr:hypothetical protein [Alphaproteobacteria bacterium]MBF0374090.1 hypothetical protein [Alphaproteobacteria bacterium]